MASGSPNGFSQVGSGSSGSGGPIIPDGFSSRAFRPSHALAELVEAIWDWDIPDGDMATGFTINVPPSTAPYFVVQYRTLTRCRWQLGGDSFDHRNYGHVLTQTTAGRSRSVPAARSASSRSGSGPKAPLAWRGRRCAKAHERQDRAGQYFQEPRYLAAGGAGDGGPQQQRAHRPRRKLSASEHGGGPRGSGVLPRFPVAALQSGPAHPETRLAFGYQRAAIVPRFSRDLWRQPEAICAAGPNRKGHLRLEKRHRLDRRRLCLRLRRSSAFDP